MSPAHFQNELAKIARASQPRGGLDLSGVHRQNLTSQRDDLLASERKGAVAKGVAAGVGLGLAAPSVLTSLQAVSDTPAAKQTLQEMFLANNLEKALGGEKALMAGQDPKKIKATAKSIAKNYYSIPESIRGGHNQLTLLRETRNIMRNPATSPMWSVGSQFSDELRGAGWGGLTDTNNRPLLSQEFVDQQANLNNIMKGVKTRESTSGIADAALRGDARVPRSSRTATPVLRALPLPSGSSTDPAEAFGQKAMRDVEDVWRKKLEAHGPMHPDNADVNIQQMQAKAYREAKDSFMSADDVVKSYKAKKFRFPAAFPGVPSDSGLAVMGKEIARRHGEVKVPTNLGARMENVYRALKRSKGQLLFAGALGGLAGGGRVVQKRRTAERIRGDSK